MAKTKNNRGLTLIEVVISVAIVGVVMGALIAVMSQSSVFSKRIDMAYTASCLAQSGIDQLRRFDFDQLLSAGAEDDFRVDVDGDGLDDFSRTMEVTANYDNNSHLAKVKVTVKKVGITLGGTVTRVGRGAPVFGEEKIVMETLISDVA